MLVLVFVCLCHRINNRGVCSVVVMASDYSSASEADGEQKTVCVCVRAHVYVCERAFAHLCTYLSVSVYQCVCVCVCMCSHLSTCMS